MKLRLSIGLCRTAFFLFAGALSAGAATIGTGNVTTSLGPTFFVDEAATGGGDVTITQPAAQAYNRSFAGLLTASQGLSRVTLTGFGFASSNVASENTATTLTFTFTYLGADEAVGGGDDVAMGSASGTYSHSITAAAEYVLAFDTPLSATLNVTGTRFLVEVAPSNATSNGKVGFKTATLLYEGVSGPKFSVAGIVTPLRLNLAKYQTVTTDSLATNRLATYVTDGVVGNDHRWQSDTTGPHWAQVTFPHPVEVGSAQVFSGVNDGSAMTTFRMQYLSGSTWVDAPGGSVTGNTNVERILVFTTPVTSSAFRLYNSADATVHLRELALYPPNAGQGYPLGTDLSLNLAYQRSATATANSAGNFALLAVDGRVNKDSKWQTTLVGANTLEIDLRISTKIGGAHLYSGSPGVAPLADFVLRYWDGAAWQNAPGGTITGNATADRVVLFSSPVTTSLVRLEFNNPGTTSVRELAFFAANMGNTGYPIGTGVIGAPPLTAKFDDYHDAYYRITNPAANRFIAVGDGAPVLSQPETTTAQGQYQILLNVENGTYRLRNRATGECLSGAQLSATPGSPLVDAPYAALPDQDWILERYDATSFLLINQWSGLAVDVQGGGTAAGTALVQSAVTGAASQRWQLVLSEKSPKKGIGGTNFVAPFKADWVYNWGLNTGATFPNTLFHPMQWGDFNWGIGSSAGPPWQYYPRWRRAGSGIHLLGFNEPDKFDQSGQSLDTANPSSEAAFSETRALDGSVLLWPRLQAANLPLIAPCPANATSGWLASFYTQATALGYRVDYTAIHNYPSPGGGSSDGMFNSLQSAFNSWGRPIWFTEFSFVDWNRNQSWSEEDNYNALAELLWRMEKASFIRKFALFVFTEDANNPAPAQPWLDVTPAPRSNSRDLNGNLTAFGQLYAAWDNVAAVETGKSYFIHNKNTRKRLASGIGSAADARSIRANDSSVRWTLEPSPTANQYYIVSAKDGRRLSSNGTSVTYVAAGTTGTAVQWSLTEDQHGWFYVGHPATSERLQLAYNNTTSVATYTMAANTTTSDAAKWRFITTLEQGSWTGAAGNTWTAAGNWTTGQAPIAGDEINFDAFSTANLNTVLGQNFSLVGLHVTAPAGSVSIGGTHTLTVGANGLDLYSATQDLTVTAPVILGASQNWTVAAGRTLAVNGGVSGASSLTVSGGGVVSLGAASTHTGNTTVDAGARLVVGTPNALPSGAANGNVVVNGTFDLNGASQTLNGLSGASTGIIDNTAVTAVSLTMGNNNVAGTLAAKLQDTGGALTLIKTGTGNLTLSGASTHSGGFTNHGTGNITPQNAGAFGSGPVVMNAGTIYPTAANYTFANALALNSATLRLGGGNLRTLTWTGPVSVSGTSTVSADGGTAGITLAGGLNLGSGDARLNSFANGTTNTISSPIAGSDGSIVVTGGTLNLNAANTFGGSFRSAATGAVLRLGHALALQNATLDLGAADAGSVSLENRDATLGALTGSRALGLGIGTVSIGNNHANTTYGGPLSGTGSLVKIGTGTLTLSGTNSYAGSTTVAAGTLALGANDALPATAISLGDGTLDAASFSAALGALDVTAATAKINLGADAALAFAASNGVDWTGGSLTLTGTFVSGVSLRFGAGASGLTSAQLAKISGPGLPAGSFALNSSGYLVAVTDTAAPTLAPASIVDDRGGGVIAVNTLVTYTVSFGEDMDASTVSAADFGNAGTAAISIGSVSETSPTSGIFTVRVTPTGVGTLRLRVNAGAALTDVAGNPLNTASAIADDTVLAVETAFDLWSGGEAFDADTNGDGVANGLAWALGASGPAADATRLLPVLDAVSDHAYFLFTYPRSDAAVASTTVHYGGDLSAWTGAVHDGTNVIITATDNGVAAGVDSVQVKIKRTLMPGSRFFARLHVTLAP